MHNDTIKDNYSKAKQLLLEALSYNPGYFPVIRDLAETLLFLGKLDESEKYLHDALSQAPTDQYLLTLYGKVLGEQGRFDEAIERLNTALGSVPDAVPFFHRLGWLYQKKGLFTNAHENYKKASELDPHFFEARFGIVLCAIQLDKLEEAKKNIEELDKLVTGRSKHVLATLKAEYLLKMGEIEEAYNQSEESLRFSKSEIVLGSSIKIGIAMAKKLLKEGLSAKAEEIANKIETRIEQLEDISPLDPYLQTYKKGLQDIQKSFYN